MEKKWMIPAMVGVLSLSLVGCVNNDPEPTKTLTQPSVTVESTAPATLEGSMGRGIHFASGREMMDNAHYYASQDGALPGCQTDDCQDGERMKDDMERVIDDFR